LKCDHGVDLPEIDRAEAGSLRRKWLKEVGENQFKKTRYK